MSPREVAANRERDRRRAWNLVQRELVETEARVRPLRLAVERAAARTFVESGAEADDALAVARAALADVEDRVGVCRLALADLARGATFRGPVAGAA